MPRVIVHTVGGGHMVERGADSFRVWHAVD